MPSLPSALHSSIQAISSPLCLFQKLRLRIRLFKPFSVQRSRKHNDNTLHIIRSLEAGSSTSFAERQGQLELDLVGCYDFYDETTRQMVPLELREGVADLRPGMNVRLAACFVLSEISLWAYYECAITEPFQRVFKSSQSTSHSFSAMRGDEHRLMLVLPPSNGCKQTSHWLPLLFFQTHFPGRTCLRCLASAVFASLPHSSVTR